MLRCRWWNRLLRRWGQTTSALDRILADPQRVYSYIRGKIHSNTSRSFFSWLSKVVGIPSGIIWRLPKHFRSTSCTDSYFHKLRIRFVWNSNESCNICPPSKKFFIYISIKTKSVRAGKSARNKPRPKSGPFWILILIRAKRRNLPSEYKPPFGRSSSLDNYNDIIGRIGRLS